MALSDIKNIVILMMENRSFDHLLGYLSLPASGRPDVDGLRSDQAWLTSKANPDGATMNQPYLSTDPYSMPAKFDPPHERTNVEKNLGVFANGQFSMDGFIDPIDPTVSSDPTVRKLVMSYFNANSAPISNFLATNFTICDKWFSSLPAGTQANRLMAMSGFSTIEYNQTPLPNQDLVYDWLTEKGITWRVYHQGLPFFAMMPRWIVGALGNSHFRDFREMAGDLLHTPPEQLPQVIFVEPTYGDAPHLGRATDDHAPSGIADGEGFILETYNAITQSDVFWQSCLFVVDFDEHGGFYDHVSPPLIPTAAPNGEYRSFQSLGVRTPGFVISPFVKKGAVCSEIFDHTSVLKLLGERFSPDGKYSMVVDSRKVQSLSVALDFIDPIVPAPGAPSLVSYFAARPPAPPPATAVMPATTGPNVLPQAFKDALDSLRIQGADASHRKFGALIAAIDAKRTITP